MPELLLFTVAEKVIFDAAGVPSLISLFTGMDIYPQAGEQLPPNAVAPKEWSVFSQWRLSDAEKVGEIVQGFSITYPNGVEFLKQTLKLDVSKESSSVAVNLPGVPVGQPGPLKIGIWIEQNNARISDVHSTYLKVNVKTVAPGQSPPHFLRIPLSTTS